MSITKRVLIVDDEEMIVDLLRDILCGEGYEVFAAYRGDEVRRQIEKTKPDIILLDLEIPQISGVMLLKIILTEYPQCKTIVMSGHFEDEIRHTRLIPESVVYLQKPFESEAVLQAVKDSFS